MAQAVPFVIGAALSAGGAVYSAERGREAQKDASRRQKRTQENLMRQQQEMQERSETQAALAEERSAVEAGYLGTPENAGTSETLLTGGLSRLGARSRTNRRTLLGG